jgi:anaerobic ribonucleoside-triphosphate reductase
MVRSDNIDSLIKAMTETMALGFAAVNDRLDHINGRLGKEEIKVRALEIIDAARQGADKQTSKEQDLSIRMAIIILASINVATIILLKILEIAIK